MTEINVAGYGDGRSICSMDALFLFLRCDFSTSSSLCLQHKPENNCYIQFSLSRDIGKYDFRAVPMLFNSNPLKLFSCLVASRVYPEINGRTLNMNQSLILKVIMALKKVCLKNLEACQDIN